MSERVEAGHVGHLLPGHAAGTLGAADRWRVRAHLPGCPTCRAELAAWRAIGAAARDAYGKASTEDDAPLRAVWRRIDASQGETGPMRSGVGSTPRYRTTVPLPARRRPSPPQLVLWSLNQLATAALLLVILAGVYLSFVPHRPGSDGIAPGVAGVPMFRGGPARTGELPGPGLAGPVDARWQVETFDGADVGLTALAVEDNTVFVGAWNVVDRTGAVHAFDAVTGARRWIFAAPDFVRSAPAVADGVVYVGCADGFLYALDAETGRQVWRSPLGGPVYDSSPVVVEGVVYVQTGGASSSPAVVGEEVYVGGGARPDATLWPGEAVLHAVDAATGQARWSLPTPDAALYAVDIATGQERWRFPTAGPVVLSAPAVADGVVYAVSFNPESGAGILYAVDVQTHAARWRFTARDSLFFVTSPAVSAGAVYVGAADGTLLAVDTATGQERWHVQTSDGPGTPPLVVGRNVFVGGHDGNLYALDAATGTERWRIQTAGPIWDFAVAAGRFVYVIAWFGNNACFDGSAPDCRAAIYAFEAAEDAAQVPAPTGQDST